MTLHSTLYPLCIPHIPITLYPDYFLHNIHIMSTLHSTLHYTLYPHYIPHIHITLYSEICLNRTLSKPKTCLNQTDFTAPSTKCLCNLNLCKPNTCLNWTNSSVPEGFCLDRFYCILYSPHYILLYNRHYYILHCIPHWRSCPWHTYHN